MQPLSLRLRGFRGIRDGLGLEELTLDLERLADGAALVAIAGANGRGKSTVMDNLHPYLTMPSRAAQAGPGGWDAEAVGARLDALKAELRITVTQADAWQAYAGVVQQHAEQRQALRTQMWTQMQDPQTAATVDRAAFHEAMQALRQQHWDDRQAALDGLYAVLTPKQKALAEQRLAGGPGHRGAMRGPGR